MKQLSSTLAALFVALALFVLSGCATHGPVGPVAPVAPVDPAVQTQEVSSLIHSGTLVAVAFGFTAVPDKTEADSIATEAYNVCNNEVLPLLNGDSVALSNGLKDILSLKAFSDPKLAKVKVIVEAALPLVMSYVPADVVSGQTSQIPDNVKAYLTAFFTGVRDGCSSYLGGVPPPPAVTLKAIQKKGVDFKAMREKLSKK